MLLATNGPKKQFSFFLRWRIIGESKEGNKPLPQSPESAANNLAVKDEERERFVNRVMVSMKNAAIMTMNDNAASVHARLELTRRRRFPFETFRERQGEAEEVCGQAIKALEAALEKMSR